MGATPDDWPAYGAVLAKLAPGSDGLPTAVQLPHDAFDQVFRCTGQTDGLLGSSYDPFVLTHDPSAPDFRVEEIDLRITAGRLADRRRLLESIGRRVVRMVENGLADEERRLRSASPPMSHTAAQALSDKEMVDHVEGRCELAEAIETIQTHQTRTRQFAKRQHTWFRNRVECRPIPITSRDTPEQIARKFLEEGEAARELD